MAISYDFEIPSSVPMAFMFLNTTCIFAVILQEIMLLWKLQKDYQYDENVVVAPRSNNVALCIFGDGTFCYSIVFTKFRLLRKLNLKVFVKGKIVNLGMGYRLEIRIHILKKPAELAFTCTKSTIEAQQEQLKWRHSVFLLLTLNIFHTFF